MTLMTSDGGQATLSIVGTMSVCKCIYVHINVCTYIHVYTCVMYTKVFIVHIKCTNVYTCICILDTHEYSVYAG